MQDLLTQPAFDEFRGDRIEPAPDLNSDNELQAWVRAYATTDYHPCGTCRMGSDDMAVVDAQMQVRGIDNLRVIDASVMPDIVSGNLNAPTQMIAERATDYLLRKTTTTLRTGPISFPEVVPDVVLEVTRGQ